MCAWRATIVLFCAVSTGFIGCWAGSVLKRADITDFRKCALLAGCDALRCRRWAFAFKVIGMNAMAIYILKSVLPLRTVASKYFMAGIDAMLPKDWAAVADFAAYFLLCYAICHFLYRKQVFVRI